MNNNFFKSLLLVAAFIVLGILGYFLLPKDEIVIKENQNEEEEFIFVHSEGCVNNPGLIKTKYGTRLFELIEEAGGETDEADLTRINLASIVSDEQKIFVPAKVVLDETNETGAETSIVNINTASKEKLMSLDGVGEGTAEKIIKYREQNGYFNTIEDLMNVSGIGESKFNGLKDDITV